MYLKTLTLRGFKSFASATTLRFEPGITCVVGPNGSGKSNVVDALSWVMGEQGVKPLRGGKMEDVVFAGTSSRPPLGRAEVTLTIDNTDGALPIDYTEVTISRLLFRSGQSEYFINGNQCRLLDVAELLSDSGLGREMHVIVGQGHLDDVLQSGPEARRALIEEAAGVLKHRRRKEKALRKLEAMQANLTRLVDLTGELRRRLGPLGRQAALARRAAAIQADLRDARLRLLADDYVIAAADLERGQKDETAALSRRGNLEQTLAQARQRESALDAAEQEQAPRLAQAQETWFSLSSLAERLRGVGRVAQERHSHLVAEPEPPRPGRDPDELEREAAGLREQEALLGERLEAARAQLTAATGVREAAEASLAEAERQLAAQARAATARAERLARLRGQVGAARSRVAAAREEEGRLADALEQAQSRARLALQEYEEFQEASAGRDDDRSGLAAAHEQAAAALSEVTARVTASRATERRASAERAGLIARKEALEEGIHAIQHGAEASAALLADPVLAGDVLGAVAGLLTVADGAQEAVTAALGGAADAVAVAGLDAAVTVMRQLKAADAGSAELVIAGDDARQAPAGGPEASYPPGVLPILDLVKAPGELWGALAGLLAGVVIADGLDEARDLVRAHPELRAVTRDGDLLGAHWARGGAARPPSLLAMRSAAEAAAADLATADRTWERAAADLAAAMAEEERAQQAVARALALMQEADAAAAAVSGQLGRLAGAARAAQDEATRLAAAIAAAREKSGRDQAALTELSARLAAEEAGEASPGSGRGAGAAPGEAATGQAAGAGESPIADDSPSLHEPPSADDSPGVHEAPRAAEAPGAEGTRPAGGAGEPRPGSRTGRQSPGGPPPPGRPRPMPALRSGPPRNVSARSRGARTRWPRPRPMSARPPGPPPSAAGCGSSRRGSPARWPRERRWRWSGLNDRWRSPPRNGRRPSRRARAGRMPSRQCGCRSASWRRNSTGWSTAHTARRSSGPSTGCGWSRSPTARWRSSVWTPRRWSPSTALTCRSRRPLSRPAPRHPPPMMVSRPRCRTAAIRRVPPLPTSGPSRSGAPPRRSASSTSSAR